MTLLLLGCLLDREGYLAARALLTDDDADGWSEQEGDCDDADGARHPEATDDCDGVDTDCDGTTDEDGGTHAWYPDLDGDGYGDETQGSTACDPDPAWVALGADCDDTRASVHPDADEVCDGEDQDCDGEADDNAIDAPIWYVDADADGWTSGTAPMEACTEPDGYSAPSGSDDCADGDPTVYPGAPEVCGDGVVNDCAATVECRYGGQAEVSQELVEDNLGGNLWQVITGNLTTDDAPDLLLTHSPAGTTEYDLLLLYAGPRTGSVLASTADVIWNATDSPLKWVTRGNADTDPDHSVLATRDNGAEGYSLLRLPSGGGDVADVPAWVTTGPDESLYRPVTSWVPSTTWVGDYGPRGDYLLAIPNDKSDGLSSADVSDYVVAETIELDLGVSLCDVTGDGVQDVVVGAGSDPALVFDGDGVRGAVTEDTALISLSGDGVAFPTCLADMDGDGLPEILVTLTDGANSGQTTMYLISNPPASGAVSDLAIAALTSGGAAVYLGVAADSGDLDGDGQNDLAGGAVVGDPADFGGGSSPTDSGCALVYYGPFSGTRSVLDSGGAALCSGVDNSYFGFQVSMSDDLNGDGLDDLVSNALLETASDGVSQGVVYIMPGQTW